jgi:hypothetical protein
MLGVLNGTRTNVTQEVNRSFVFWSIHCIQERRGGEPHAKQITISRFCCIHPRGGRSAGPIHRGSDDVSAAGDVTRLVAALMVY